MIDYLIIDDEPIAHRIIEGYSEQLPHLRKVGNCYHAFEAMQFLKTQAVELIFLDINMPKLTGFELLRCLDQHQHSNVIVTTAYKEFAWEGYELNVVDYLLKPFSFERFVKAIHKIQSKQQPIASSVRQETIFLKGDKKHYQVPLVEILYLEAYGNYTKVCTQNRTIVTAATLSSYEQLLPKHQFMRIHKSYMVSILKIESIEGNRIQLATKELPIGQTYRQGVHQLLK